MEFNDIPLTGINVTASGVTTQTVRNVNGKSVLDFYIEERLGDREPRNFWVEVIHNPTNTYLANKTNSINNQGIRSTTAILVGMIHYQQPIVDPNTGDETTPGKHIIDLEDISLIPSFSQRQPNRSTNLPWTNTSPIQSTTRNSRGTKRPKRGRQTLSQMSSTSTSTETNSTLAVALAANPLPSNFPTPATSENDQQQNLPQDQEQGPSSNLTT